MHIYFLLLFLVRPFLQNDLDDPERGMIFVCSATHKTKSMFFFLAQTEQGDIFKVTLETDEEMVSKDGEWMEDPASVVLSFPPFFLFM